MLLAVLVFLTGCSSNDTSNKLIEDGSFETTVSENTGDDDLLKYQILGEDYQTVISIFENNGYDVVPDASGNILQNTDYNSDYMSRFGVEYMSKSSCFLLSGTNAIGSALMVELFVNDGLVIAYYVLLGDPLSTTIAEYINESEFSEINGVSSVPEMKQLLGKTVNGEEWDHSYNGRLVYSEEEYSVQFDVFKADLESGNLISESSKMLVDSFYVESKNEFDNIKYIPKLNGLCRYIGVDFDSVKSTLGYSLSGPADGYRDIMNELFCLNESATGLDCYIDTDTNEYYASKNGEMVVFGSVIRGFDVKIADMLATDEIVIEPISYMVRGVEGGNYLASYLWKIDNGYLSIIATPLRGYKWYDLPIYTLAYVTDLEYLGYLSHNQMDIHEYGKVAATQIQIGNGNDSYEEVLFDSSVDITAWDSFSGTLRTDGIRCYIDFNAYVTAEVDGETVLTNKLYLSDTDSLRYMDYVGIHMTLTGTLSKNSSTNELILRNPQIMGEQLENGLNVYSDWDTTDNVTKFWDGANLLRELLYKNPDVYSVEFLDEGKNIEYEGGNIRDNLDWYFIPLQIEINGIDTVNFNYRFYFSVYESHIDVSIDNPDYLDGVYFEYDWNGNLLTDYNGEIYDYISEIGIVANGSQYVGSNSTHSHIYSAWYSDGNVHYKTCSCGDVVTESHAFDSGIITKTATHTSSGIKTYTCAKCDLTKDELISSTTEHTFANWLYDNQSTHSRYCVCGEMQTEYHNFNIDYDESTSSANVYSCFCGATYSEEITTTPSTPSVPENSTYRYSCYYAEYIVDENTTGIYYASEADYVINGITENGGVILGEIKYYEITTDEYMGEYFQDSSGVWVYLS